MWFRRDYEPSGNRHVSTVVDPCWTRMFLLSTGLSHRTRMTHRILNQVYWESQLITHTPPSPYVRRPSFTVVSTISSYPFIFFYRRCPNLSTLWKEVGGIPNADCEDIFFFVSIIVFSYWWNKFVSKCTVFSEIFISGFMGPFDR